MTFDEFKARHRERYGRIMRREMTLDEAFVEHDADWQALHRVPPHLFATPRVVVSPRRVMDVPDEPGAVGADFEGCES